MSDELYSYHIFLFPFKMRFDDKRKDKTFTPDEKKWEHKPFKIENSENYNEYIYFYDFVRESIFDIPNSKESVVKHYEYNTKDLTYEIGVRNCRYDSYCLKVDKIALDIFNTDVGVLSFHLANHNANLDANDILRINEYGRRIYPQFIAGEANFTDAPKGSFLADYIELKSKSLGVIAREDFLMPKKAEEIATQNLIPRFILELLGNDTVESEQVVEQQDMTKDILITPVLDDRMFVVCWYDNDQLCYGLNKYNETTKEYGYAASEYWYKFLFVDKSSPSCANQKMFSDLLQKHSYARWIRDEVSRFPQISTQLFGITRYSFMLLTNLGGWLASNHLRTVYYQIVLLGLVQRASILNFSEKVTQISKLTDDSKIVNDAQTLYKKYIQFVNKIYFREVTPQEQGIELYDLLQKQMRIAEHVKDLDEEIAELHNYVSLLEDKERNKEAAKLSEQSTDLAKVANIFLPASFVAALMAIISDEKIDVDGIPDWDTIIYSIILIGITIAVLFYGKKITEFLSKKSRDTAC